jgi:hypothetical protein
MSINQSIFTLHRGLGLLGPLAGFTPSISTLSILAQGLVRVERGNAFGILLWVAIFGIRLELK